VTEAPGGKKAHGLAPKAFAPLPLRSIRPAGWLRRQLRIEADGLSGHLCEFWEDAAESGWIGGKGEGWERGPYWLEVLVNVLGEPALADRLESICFNALPATLESVSNDRAHPEMIQVDNGPEFISKDMDFWAYFNGLKLDFSRPGKPTDNALIESSNGRLRQECLNAHWFLSVADAQRNQVRPMVNSHPAWTKDGEQVNPNRSLITGGTRIGEGSLLRTNFPPT